MNHCDETMKRCCGKFIAIVFALGGILFLTLRAASSESDTTNKVQIDADTGDEPPADEEEVYMPGTKSAVMLPTKEQPKGRRVYFRSDKSPVNLVSPSESQPQNVETQSK